MNGRCNHAWHPPDFKMSASGADALERVRLPLEMGLVSRVPSLYVGFFDESVKQLADGPSMVEGTEHIREGVVIRPLVERDARNLGRVQLKIVSNAFLEKDSQ